VLTAKDFSFTMKVGQSSMGDIKYTSDATACKNNHEEIRKNSKTIKIVHMTFIVAARLIYL
jgi:hypothetical protein